MIYEEDFDPSKVKETIKSGKSNYGVDPYWGEDYTRDYNGGKLYDYFGHEVIESKNDFR